MRTTIKFTALASTVLVAAALVYAVLVHNGTVSSGRVQIGADVPERQLKQLLATGLITSDESLEYFYSEGRMSITEGGSILTDRRVIAYSQDPAGRIQTWQIPNYAIVSVTKTQQGDADDHSIYRVATSEEDWIELWLPHEHGDGERFAAAVQAKIAN